MKRNLLTRLLLAAIAVCVLLYFSHAQKNCRLEGKDSEGDYYIDLTTMKEPFLIFEPSAGDYNFRLSFCKSLKYSCQDKGENFKVIQVHKDPSQGYCFYLAAAATQDDSSVALKEGSNIDGGVILKYNKGESYSSDSGFIYTRKTEITAVCSKDAPTSTVRFDGEDVDDASKSSIYKFTVTTAAACPKRGAAPPPPGPDDPSPSFWRWGVGATVLTITCVAVAAYLVIGILVNKFKLKKTGVEIIPQLFIWKEIPFLVKDGVMLIVEGIATVVKQRKGGYSEVA